MCFTARVDADLHERPRPARKALVVHHGSAPRTSTSELRVHRSSRDVVYEERRPPLSSAPSTIAPLPVILPGPRTVRSSSRASSRRSGSRARSTHYVEVEEHAESSYGGGEDEIGVRSASSGRRSVARPRSERGERKAESVAGRTEYSVHEREREIRREYGGRPREEFDTYQYVEAPDRRRRSGSGSRRSFGDDPRASRDSYRVRMRDDRIAEDEDRDRGASYRRIEVRM